MASDSDDPLRWDGDEEQPPQASPKAPAPALPEGWEAVGKGSEEVVTVASDGSSTEAVEHGAPAQLSTTMLLAVGVLAGIYLLYTVGWVIGGLRLQVFAEGFLLSDALAYRVSMVLGMVAPTLWFLTAWVLTGRSKSWVRIAALLIGAAVLVPWPFVLVGSVGGGL